MGYIDDPRNDPYTVQMANLRQTNQDVQNMVSDRQQQAGAAADGISADTALPTGLPDKHHRLPIERLRLPSTQG